MLHNNPMSQVLRQRLSSVDEQNSPISSNVSTGNTAADIFQQVPKDHNTPNSLYCLHYYYYISFVLINSIIILIAAI